MSNAKNKHRNIRKGGHVKTVRYHDLLRAKRTQNPLSGLNPAKVRRLYELYREGKYADVQLAWDALEEYDDMLGTVLERRQSALGEMEWDVLIDARAVGENAALQALAEAQQDYITRRLREVENLSDAIKWLGLANFRRYSALEVLPAGGGERWLPIHHWLLCRPALEGAWCYNELAETSCTRTEPIDMSAVILREVARPIDLVAMFLISAKEAAIDGWDSFLEVFGNPALFFKMPPGTSDAQRDEFAAIIKEISSDGSGVYPDGGEIHTVETSAANADAFSSRAEWCDKALVRRATGGLLTVLAESGSGTLAGSAHMEAFRQIAANDAISIAECINRQYVRRRIAAEFPGMPVLVYFTLTQPVINDRAATVNMLCQLAGQRWRATDEAVSEEVGVEVHTEEVQSMNYEVRSEGSAPAAPVMNIGTSVSAPAELRRDEEDPCSDGIVANANSDLEDASDSEPPLNDGELAALRALGGELNPAQVAADAEYTTREILAGLQEPAEDDEDSEEEVEQALRAAADLDGESGTKVPRSDEVSSEEEVVANAKVEDITALLKEEEEALEDDGLVMNAGNPCRAKNPAKCPYHGGFENPLVGKTGNAKSLGLPDFSSAEVKGEPSLKRTKSKVADALMRGGIEVKTVDGDSVTFNGEVPDHWLGLDGKQPKTRKERDKRYSRLGDALRATVYPHEIWEHHGKKVYVRKYRTPDGKNFTMAGVIKENGVARTYYWDKPEEMEKTRQGKLLYCRTK